jgi:hypothetical protein
MNAQAYRRTFGFKAFLASIIAGSLVSNPLAAAEVSHGEMAAAIRSASYPCAHVRKIDRASDNAWVVECNSGTFRVSRDQDGRFDVIQATEN